MRHFGMARHHPNQRDADQGHGQFGHEIRRLLAHDGADHQERQSAEAEHQFREEKREGIAGGHRQSCEGVRAAAGAGLAEASDVVDRDAAEAVKVFIMLSTVACEESRIGCGWKP